MIHNLGKLSRRCGLVAGAAALCFALAASGPPARSQSADGPQYAPDGNLLLPAGIDTWVFVGSSLGLSYTRASAKAASATPESEHPPSFHNVSINRAGYETFLATGRFPDGTMLAMQVFEPVEKKPKNVLSRGAFNGRRVAVEVAVKNTARPDGQKTPWAYYDFSNPSDPSRLRASAAAFPDVDCANCHLHHASTDYVWVQFYPVLRDRR